MPSDSDKPKYKFFYISHAVGDTRDKKNKDKFRFWWCARIGFRIAKGEWTILKDDANGVKLPQVAVYALEAPTDVVDWTTRIDKNSTDFEAKLYIVNHLKIENEQITYDVRLLHVAIQMPFLGKKMMAEYVFDLEKGQDPPNEHRKTDFINQRWDRLKKGLELEDTEAFMGTLEEMERPDDFHSSSAEHVPSIIVPCQHEFRAASNQPVP